MGFLICFQAATAGKGIGRRLPQSWAMECTVMVTGDDTAERQWTTVALHCARAAAAVEVVDACLAVRRTGMAMQAEQAEAGP